MAGFDPTHPLGPDAAFTNAGISLAAESMALMAQLFAMQGKGPALMKMLNIRATPGKATETPDFTALPLGPDQWMLVSARETVASAPAIADRIRGLGYVSEQSDSRIRFRVSGPKARELMSRGCRLDLHPDSAGKDFCAQTPMAQVGVLLHQAHDDPVYDLYVYSGFARSFWHWLTATAKQFG